MEKKLLRRYRGKELKILLLQKIVLFCNLQKISAVSNNVLIMTSFENICFEAFTATICNEVFLGDRPCDDGVGVQRFGDCLCFHHQGLMSNVVAHCIYTQRVCCRSPVSCPTMNYWGSNEEDFIVFFLKFVSYARKTVDYIIVLRKIIHM